MRLSKDVWLAGWQEITAEFSVQRTLDHGHFQMFSLAITWYSLLLDDLLATASPNRERISAGDLSPTSLYEPSS